MDSHAKISRSDVLKLGAVAGTGLALTGAAARTASVEAANVSSPVTLNTMTWGGPSSVQNTWKTVTAIYPSLFKNMKLNVTVPGGGDFDVAKALRLALTAKKNIPDCLQLNYTQVSEFAEAGVLEDLSDVIGPLKNDLYAGALQVASYNGKLIAFPFEVKSKLFFYRGDLLDKAGIDVNSISSVASFINAGKTLHAKFPKSYLLNLNRQPVQYWLGEILSAYPNAAMANQDGTFQITSNKAFSDTFTFLKQLKDAGITYPTDDWTTDWAQAYKQGAIAGALLASWMKFFLPGYATSAQAGKWNVTAWPSLAPLANQKFGSEAGGSVWVIPKDAANKDAAKLFLSKWFLDHTSTLALYEAGGGTPLLKSMKSDVLAFANSSKRPAGLTDDQWKLLPKNYFARTNGKTYAQLELDSFDWVRVFPYDPAATKEITILQQALFTVMAGKASVAQALQQAQSDMTSQVGNPYQQ